MMRVIFSFMLIAVSMSFTSNAEANIYCKTKKAIANIESSLLEACESGDLVNTETPNPDAEPGDPDYLGWFFTIPEDMQCDLGLNLPDLDFGLDFGLGKLNVCNVLKKVSENAVEQVNEEFDRIEQQIDDAEEGINDDIDVDLDDMFDDGWDENIGDGGN
tara:strand:- start:560 stop:1039 length:480 start_codon:yes stop_codon:yes gene_type:complete